MRSKLKIARNYVQTLRRALLSPTPEGLEHCLPLLTDAAGCLTTIQRELALTPNDDPELAGELKALKQDLRAVNKLIEHGATFWQGWGRLLGSATGGYMPSGEPRPVAPVGSISLEG